MASSRAGRQVYAGLQATIGAHLRPAFVDATLASQRHLARTILDTDRAIAGTTIVEVGTGWVPLLPLGFWLCGASTTHTFDLNRHLSLRVCRRAFSYIASRKDYVIELWRPFEAVDRIASRVDIIRELQDQPLELLAHAGIRYHAPADAGNTGLANRSVDIHYSHNVLEHIDRPTLGKVFCEAHRVLSDDGRAIHMVDMSDHFSHYDPAISCINFLRFDEPTWHWWGGNALAFHNRLRCSHFKNLLNEQGWERMRFESNVNERALETLQSGFPIDSSFAAHDPRDLCTTELLFVARPGGARG